MSNLGTRHPSDDQLLHFADGEMTTPQSEDTRGHLKACWQCRNELEEIERTIGECVRYRKIVLDTCLPPPPAPWFDIYPRLAGIDESQRRRRLLNRILEPLAAVWCNPRRWIPAVAMVVMIAVVVQQFRRAPSVAAAELLRKAVAAATSRPRTARHIRIRTRTQHLTRIVGNSGTPVKTKTAEESTVALESLFQLAHYSWDDPLSARAYAEWRDQLSDKRDEVTREADHYQLRTTTDSGELVEATLKLSSLDLHAVEGTLQFRNREWVEISELPDTPAPSPKASTEAGDAVAASRTDPSSSNRPSEGPAPAATPGEELAVLAALHSLGADLGDPVEATRSGGEILVTGTGIGIERQQEIRDELRAMPRVTVRLSSELSPQSPGLEKRSPSRISVGPGTGPIQAAMEEHLGGHAAFEHFADGIFDLTDTFMARAHALRRLAQRFPPDIETQMTSQQIQLLERLRQEHAEALVGDLRELERRIHPALSMPLDDAGQVNTSGQWQNETEQLFVEARHAETMLVALLGASPEETQSPELPAQVAASVTRLLKRAENYLRLTTGR